MSLKLLLVFAVTEFLLSLTPGPAVLLIVSQGVTAGFRLSLQGAVGILTGNAIYFFLSALGLGTLLLASTTLFQIIKWLGIAYLILTGIRMLFSKSPATEDDAIVDLEVTRKRPLKLFSQGLLTQLANPKAVVFFTALLPQFVSPNGQVLEQFLLLGVVSIAVEFPVLVSYGWLAQRGSRLFPERFSSLPRIAGGFLISAGLGLASMRRP
jgi:homoserine/homoserine lactone efflux protein